jgi:GAF domain-containing protein
MNRNALGKKFNRLSVFAAVIPLIVAAYMFFQSSDPLGIGRFVLPALAYALLLGCLIAMAYIFKKMCAGFAWQLEKFQQDSQKRNAELNALREITELTKDGMPAEDLMKLILDKAMQVVAVRNGSVFLVDPAEPDGLRLITATPKVAVEQNGGGQKTGRYSFVKSVIESGKTLRIQDIENDPRTMKSNDPKYGSPSFISLPVYKNKQVIAVVNLANKENGGIFTEGDERILTIMLGAIGVGIENISLHNKIKQHLADNK